MSVKEGLPSVDVQPSMHVKGNSVPVPQKKTGSRRFVLDLAYYRNRYQTYLRSRTMRSNSIGMRSVIKKAVMPRLRTKVVMRSLSLKQFSMRPTAPLWSSRMLRKLTWIFT